MVRQKKQHINDKGLKNDEAFRIDLIVEDQIILEFKAMNTLNNIYIAQLLTYQKFPS